MRLYVIRHGETAWNKEKRMQGRKDIPLNERGMELARITGEKMRDLPIDLCIRGPLVRTKQTAELVLAGREVPIVIDPRITEISFGDWEGECILDSDKITPGFVDTFHKDPWNCPSTPNGEDFHDVIARTKEFYEDLIANPAYQDKHILISTHGAASRCFLHNFTGDSHDIWLGGIPENCAVTTVDVTQGLGKIVELDHVYWR